MLRLGRPVTALAGALFAALVCALFVASAVDAYQRPADPTGLPVSIVQVVDSRADAGHWLVGTRTWQLVARPSDTGVSGTRLEVTLRPQAHDDELSAGRMITAVSAGADVLWLRLPSGVVLETEDHPRFAVPVNAAIALIAGGFGLFFVGIAVRSAREMRSWTADAGTPDVRLDVGTVLVLLGLVAFVAVRAYPRPAPLVFVAPVVAALFAVLVVRRRRADDRAAGGRAAGDRWAGHLVRSMTADALPREARGNTAYLYLVARPARWRRRPVLPHPAELAVRVERLLAAQGVATAWAGLGRLRPSDRGGTVRLTLGVDGGRVGDDGVLIITLVKNGLVTLACGRGVGEAAVPMRDPALVLGLTRVVLILAGTREPDATAEWQVAMFLRGVQVIRPNGGELRERTDALAAELAQPLLDGLDATPG